MNETLNIIKNRTSVKQYQSEQISEAELQAILEAAIHAPTCMFQQKWHFSVIQNKELIAKIEDVLKEGMKRSGVPVLAEKANEPGFHPFNEAPTVIVVSGEEKALCIQIDCAVAAQNILIAAASLNIGSNIMTSTDLLFKSEKGAELAREIGIPEGYVHMCAITLGYMAGEKPAVKPRNKEVINTVC